MAEIRPLHGLHYSDTSVCEKCVTQPYDKITPALRETYIQRHPHTLAHLLLPVAEHGKTPYETAALRLQEWRKDGVLLHDESAALYPYRQSFEFNGDTHTRTGFVCRVRIEDYAARIIYPHERTLSGPREDRLNLLRATRTHFGLIFLLYEDDGTIQSLIDAQMAHEPDFSVRDDFSVLNDIWRITDSATIDTLCAAMATRELFIADGHHRYETSRVYARENPHDNAAQYTLAMCVNMASPLVVLPTHRTVRNCPAYTSNSCADALRKVCEVTASASHEAMMKDVMDAHDVVVIGWYDGTRYYTLHIKDDAAMRTRAPEKSDAWRALDIAVLHTLILEDVLHITPDQMEKGGMVGYHRDAEEALQMVDSGAAQCAFFVKPTRPQQVCDVARNDEVMPQKSTDFYPKLLSGLMMYALDTDR